MIYRREILKGFECPPEYEINLLDLLVKINKVRDAWSQPMIVTSGYRTVAEHKRIYRKRIAAGKHVPWGSRHLFCQAVDISDPDGKLYEWCKKNEELLREIGLWIEEDQGSWVHFQSVAFTSYKATGTIFFKP